MNQVIKMQKTNKSDVSGWEYEQQVKQSRKKNKQLRNLKATRKSMWMEG